MNKNNLDEIDKLLYEEMPFLSDKIIESLPQEKNLNHTFSPEFESNMNNLIRKNKRNNSKKIFIKYAKAISLAFILLIFGTFINTDTYANLRDIINSITEVFSTHTSIEFSNKKNNNTTKTFAPSYIPKNYDKIEEIVNDQYREITYKDNEGLLLTYTCQVIHSSNFIFDTEDAQLESIKVDNEDGTLINKNKTLTLHYKKYNYFFVITVDYKKDSDIDYLKKELIKIAESKF